MTFAKNEEGVNDIDILDVPTDMLNFQKIGKELPNSVIQNCWDHTGLYNFSRISSDQFMVDLDVQATVQP